MLVKGLLHELRKDLAKMPVQGGKPEEDDALIAAMKEVGLAHEQFLREEKLKERTTSAPSGKQKGKRKWETVKSNATADEEKAPSGKKPKRCRPCYQYWVAPVHQGTRGRSSGGYTSELTGSPAQEGTVQSMRSPEALLAMV